LGEIDDVHPRPAVQEISVGAAHVDVERFPLHGVDAEQVGGGRPSHVVDFQASGARGYQEEIVPHGHFPPGIIPGLPFREVDGIGGIGDIQNDSLGIVRGQVSVKVRPRAGYGHRHGGIGGTVVGDFQGSGGIAHVDDA